MAASQTPVLLIHGLWLHSESWGSWVNAFREAGYDPSAPGWPGDGETVDATRKHPEDVAGHGIDDVVAHYTEIIDAMKTPPILVGHSFGGLIVQRLLGQGLGQAGIAIDAAPIKGVRVLPLSSLRVASVALRNPANRDRAVALSSAQFRYGFGNAIPQDESDELFERWAIPSPGRPLFEAASANLVRSSPAAVEVHNETRGPLLLVAGGADHTVPASITRSTLKLYRKSSAITDFKEFHDRGHSLALDSRWREVADHALTWLGKHGL
jgi:alpha-beta hydrolase superfamily lysophospholipase